MMAAALLQRRMLLQGGAAMGSLALSGGLGSAVAAPEPPIPLAGSLVAWARVGTGEMRVSLANFDPSGQLLGQAADMALPLAVGASLRSAMAGAADAARAAVARSWGVSPDSCEILPGRIIERGGGRSIGYVAWADIA